MRAETGPSERRFDATGTQRSALNLQSDRSTRAEKEPTQPLLVVNRSDRGVRAFGAGPLKSLLNQRKEGKEPQRHDL